MSEMQTMVRTTLVIDGDPAQLAQDQDVEALKVEIEEATTTTGTFVDFVVVGNHAVSVLITPRSRVMITTETVQFDPRDTGDEDEPFGGFFDF